MGIKVVDLKQSKWYCGCLDDDIPSDDIVFLVTYFVLSNRNMIYEFVDVKTRGRPINPPEYMIALLIYGALRHINGTDDLAEMAEFHNKFRYVSGDLKPSGRVLRKFIQEYGNIFKQLLAATLNLAYTLGLTDFDFVCVDGTIIKATNSPFNVIYYEDALILLENLLSDSPCIETIDDLRRPAKKLFYNKIMSKERKIELLNKMIDVMDDTGKEKLPAFDIDSRSMHTKKGYEEPSYNMQLATDTQSKLICAVHISQHPTDHHELPPTMNKAVENLPVKPHKVSADTIYKQESTLQYLEKEGYDGIIPDQKQNRINQGKIPDNLFHKDNFTYDFNNNTFICPSGAILKHQSTIYEKSKDEQGTKIPVNSYYNYEACKSCKYRIQCTPQSSTHRVIQERGSKLSIKMKYKLEQEEYKKDYKQRGHTSEPPNGTLKEQYHINQIISRGQEDKENKVTLKAVAYNLRVIFNKILEADETIDFKKLVKYDIDDYMIEITNEFDNIKFKLIELKKSKSITK